MKYYEDDIVKEEKDILKTNRSVPKLVLLTIATLGVYGIIFYLSISYDINRIIGRHDGKKTLNFLLALLLSTFTIGLVLTVWMYQLTERIENELKRREIEYDFG